MKSKPKLNSVIWQNKTSLFCVFLVSQLFPVSYIFFLNHPPKGSVLLNSQISLQIPLQTRARQLDFFPGNYSRFNRRVEQSLPSITQLSHTISLLRTLLEWFCSYQHAEDFYLKSSLLEASYNKSSQNAVKT